MVREDLVSRPTQYRWPTSEYNANEKNMFTFAGGHLSKYLQQGQHGHIIDPESGVNDFPLQLARLPLIALHTPLVYYNNYKRQLLTTIFYARSVHVCSGVLSGDIRPFCDGLRSQISTSARWLRPHQSFMKSFIRRTPWNLTLSFLASSFIIWFLWHAWNKCDNWLLTNYGRCYKAILIPR